MKISNPQKVILISLSLLIGISLGLYLSGFDLDYIIKVSVLILIAYFSTFLLIWRTYKADDIHKNQLDQGLFLDLQNKYRFEKESLNKNQYFGLNGYYKNYYVKLYFNPLSTEFTKKRYKEIGVLIYHKEIDIDKISSLKSFLPNLPPSKENRLINYFRKNHVALHLLNDNKTVLNDLLKSLNKIIGILKQQEIYPISKNEVNILLKENKLEHGPKLSQHLNENHSEEPIVPKRFIEFEKYNNTVNKN